MIIDAKTLLGASVCLQTGVSVGRVVNFELDTETRTLAAIHVATSIIKGLLHKTLIVGHQQIISIDRDRVIVRDTAIPAEYNHLLRTAQSPAK